MILLEILKYTLPSVIVFLTAYFIFKEQNKRDLEKDKINQENKSLERNKDVVMPVKLQAYERLILFLQRIHPNQLVIRNSNPGQTVVQLQSKLMKSIRDEFEHNMSQQLYVSDLAWSKVVNAKEDVLKQINAAASQLNSDSSGNELGTLLISGYGQLNPDPIQAAIKQLKVDVTKGL